MPVRRPLAHLPRVSSLALALALAGGCTGAPARPVADGAGDVAAPPLLRLAPATLPGGLALEQRLTFRHGERTDTVDALVEADADAVRLLVHAQGQVALRLAWDGDELTQERAPWLPAQLQGERVLSDVQLVYWPREAIAAALPDGWMLTGDATHRFLTRAPAATPVVAVDYLGDGRVVVRYPQQGFELRIESREVTP